MYEDEYQKREKSRKDRAKKAIALAMQSRWEEAVALNQSLIGDFPQDLEAYNRLGKALSELGRNREAKEAFQHALEISPHNGIAKKNLYRLMHLGDETPRAAPRKGVPPRVFIEETGKAGVTTLMNLASSDVLRKLAAGHPVHLQTDGVRLKVFESSGEYVGQVEPRLASRLSRLIKGGNGYEATVTSVGEHELTVIIREVFQHSSQARHVSFPSRDTGDARVVLPGALLAYELGEEQPDDTEKVAVKDWSDDDTEPGDDDAFTPVIHRIINAADETAPGDEDL